MTKTEREFWKRFLRRMDKQTQDFAVAVRDFVDDSMKQLEKDEADAKRKH